MLDWRKIETALVELARDWVESQGWIDEDTKTGDKSFNLNEGPPIEINLTELAKDLAKELER